MASTTNTPVVLISGCSTGFGRDLVLASVKKSLRVIATARRLDSIEDLTSQGAVQTLPLDVTASPQDLHKFAEKAHSIYGQIDYLINNAGYLLGGAIEESTHEENYAQFSTLFFGVINLTNAILPYMREARKGTIVNVGSQGGSLNIAGAGVYCAAKAAIDSISETWSKELSDFNVRVMSVQLGAFRTAVATSNNLKIAQTKIDGYKKAHDWVDGFNATAMKEPGDTRKASERLLDIISKDGEVPFRLPLGDDAVDLVGGVYKRHMEELEKWRPMCVGTSYDD